MQFSLWVALVGAGTLISFTPGAGAINTMSNALNAGFRRSIWASSASRPHCSSTSSSWRSGWGCS